jgi:hypothetical protein
MRINSRIVSKGLPFFKFVKHKMTTHLTKQKYLSDNFFSRFATPTNSVVEHSVRPSTPQKSAKKTTFTPLRAPVPQFTLSEAVVSRTSSAPIRPTLEPATPPPPQRLVFPELPPSPIWFAEGFSQALLDLQRQQTQLEEFGLSTATDSYNWMSNSAPAMLPPADDSMFGSSGDDDEPSPFFSPQSLWESMSSDNSMAFDLAADATTEAFFL